jgi:hypothetical protein
MAVLGQHRQKVNKNPSQLAGCQEWQCIPVIPAVLEAVGTKTAV